MGSGNDGVRDENLFQVEVKSGSPIGGCVERWHLKSRKYDRWVKADLNQKDNRGRVRLINDAPRPLGWEVFHVKYFNDNTVYLFSESARKWVSARLDEDNTPLRASAPRDREWERLTVHIQGNGPAPGPAPAPAPAPAPQGKSGGHHKVMSLNFWIFRGNTWSQIYHINQHKPDLLGVQEALHVPCEDVKRHTGMNYIGLGRDGGNRGEYTAVFYNPGRYSVLEGNTQWLQSHNRDRPGNKDYGNHQYQRTFTWAKLRDNHNGGQVIYFYNTHLDVFSQPSRWKSTQQIIEHIRARAFREGAPVFLSGDMNTGWGSSEMGVVRQHFDGIQITGIDMVLGNKQKTGRVNGYDFRDGAASDHPIVVGVGST